MIKNTRSLNFVREFKWNILIPNMSIKRHICINYNTFYGESTLFSALFFYQTVEFGHKIFKLWKRVSPKKFHKHLHILSSTRMQNVVVLRVCEQGIRWPKIPRRHVVKCSKIQDINYVLQCRRFEQLFMLVDKPYKYHIY